MQQYSGQTIIRPVLALNIKTVYKIHMSNNLRWAYVSYLY